MEKPRSTWFRTSSLLCTSRKQASITRSVTVLTPSASPSPGRVPSSLLPSPPLSSARHSALRRARHRVATIWLLPRRDLLSGSTSSAGHPVSSSATPCLQRSRRKVADRAAGTPKEHRTERTGSFGRQPECSKPFSTSRPGFRSLSPMLVGCSALSSQQRARRFAFPLHARLAAPTRIGGSAWRLQCQWAICSKGPKTDANMPSKMSRPESAGGAPLPEAWITLLAMAFTSQAAKNRSCFLPFALAAAEREPPGGAPVSNWRRARTCGPIARQYSYHETLGGGCASAVAIETPFSLLRLSVDERVAATPPFRIGMYAISPATALRSHIEFCPS
eukprot:scaffold162_cov275-Pinguiococcus_pyrenoidosus.AAC.9